MKLNIVKSIVSYKNPELKNLRLLFDKGRERKKQGLFVIEGEREIKKALSGKYLLKKIFIENKSQLNYSEIKNTSESAQIYEVEKSIFERIGRRSGSEKIIAIAKIKSHELKDLFLPKNGLIIVVEAPEKPGNIGALYRTAAASKIDAIIIADPKNDLYNPNIIRSSLGSVFLVPTALASSKKVITFLKNKSFQIVTTFLEKKGISYNKYEYQTPCALVFGMESIGLNENWYNVSDQNLVIPMSDNIDSLNLSVSAAIFMYEATRKNNRLEKK